MSSYMIYGKRTKSFINKQGELIDADKNFSALDWAGRRVPKSKGFAYATKEDAKERLEKAGNVDGAVFEIRKV